MNWPPKDGGAGERAAREQIAASDPGASVFVDASAGSGKTKVLTDRLLRLMLGDAETSGAETPGADPARIQCLTFTKAAAAEMAVRLQGRLGAWVTLDDAALDAELARLAVRPNEVLRRRARALFARVLDLPGGMRIGTIHAFCQSLLRRFPLEAALSPQFELLEESDAAAAWRAARETMLAESGTPAARDALEALAGLATLDQFGRQVAQLQSDRARLDRALALGPAGLAAAQRRVLGIASATREDIVQEAVGWPAEAAFRAVCRRVQAGGSPTVEARASYLLDWLALPAAERAAQWLTWKNAFFRESDGARRGPGAMVNARLAKTDPDLPAAMQAEQDRIEAVDDRCRALELADASAALLLLARPVVEAYGGHKQATGRLDYADLIDGTSRLLHDPGAAWVLYKLDGGLDHLLLDEMQDTSPAQWQIAHALTDEFFVGQGTRVGAGAAARTVFAVGDRKQSIYSFQGADPDAFEHARTLMEKRVRDAGAAWRTTALDVSFRSARPVLDLVDAVFAQPAAAAGVVREGQALAHYAHRAGAAGMVELWPLVPFPAPPEPPAWHVHDRYTHHPSSPQLLADAIARWLKDQIGTAVLESRGRPLAAGDVLILVRRRNDLSRALVRALKAEDVQVAGLDRMMLTAQPAVEDLLALCDTLLLPQDELSLACVLTSPLGGLSDDSLMQLALGRHATLWDTLRQRAPEQAAWAAAWHFLATLFARADFVTPHALLAEALGPLGGQARLLARLGAEAAEPIDELLGAALDYPGDHAASLQGFVQWVREAGAEIKREPEHAGDAVRIMTVHGAKGLQSPLVILPDTTGLPPDEDRLFWIRDDASGRDVPLWVAHAGLRCAAADRLREAAGRRRMEEHNRLLYVALTRAEDRLVICGCDTRRGAPDACWYRLVEDAFADLPAAASAEPAPFPEAGPVRRLASAQTAPIPDARDAGARPAVPLPAWAGQAPDWRPLPPPAEDRPARPLAPSRPQDASLGPVPRAASPLAARAGMAFGLRRGQLLHALLQHLPDQPLAARAGAARQFLARPGHFLTATQVEELAAETLALLQDARLAALFAPDSRAEVPLTGVVAGSVIGGLVDRLAVLPDKILVADYKTNREPPVALADTPVLYLRQMSAYRAVLAGIFPGRPVECALVWTRSGVVSWLPDELLEAHAPDRLVAA